MQRADDTCSRVNGKQQGPDLHCHHIWTLKLVQGSKFATSEPSKPQPFQQPNTRDDGNLPVEIHRFGNLHIMRHLKHMLKVSDRRQTVSPPAGYHWGRWMQRRGYARRWSLSQMDAASNIPQLLSEKPQVDTYTLVSCRPNGAAADLPIVAITAFWSPATKFNRPWYPP